MFNFNIFIVTAPSGSGKTSLMRAAMGQDREVISTTTRPMRKGEQDGVDYHFVTCREFLLMLIRNEFVEITCYDGNFYGATYKAIEDKIKDGHAFIVVDLDGAEQVSLAYPDNFVSFFIDTSIDDARLNMLERGDDISNIKKRLETFEAEKRNMDLFDYIFENKRGHYDRTVEDIKAIVNEYVI